jgi:myo-inositol-1(or 4)-monophosphatase
MADDISTLLSTAVEGARRAGKILAQRFDQERTVEFKGGINLVTDADRASEQELIAFIRARHPGHAILAEESGATEGTQFQWVIDPLDGTTNYAHRIPHFCVSVAVRGEAGIMAGAVFDPIRKEMFSAGKGRGAELNGQPLQVSSATRMDRALLCTGFPYDVQENPEAPLGLFGRLIRKAQGIRRMGAAALDLAYVAAGRVDGFFEFGLKPWDIAAGALLVWEAEGQMVQIDGAPLDITVGNILACAPGIFPELSAECRTFLAQARGEATD